MVGDIEIVEEKKHISTISTFNTFPMTIFIPTSFQKPQETSKQREIIARRLDPPSYIIPFWDRGNKKELYHSKIIWTLEGLELF